MGLLGSILSSPAKGLMYIFEQVQGRAELELYDETIWQQKLLDLQMRHELGEIDADEYEAQEAIILEQLDLIVSMRSDDDSEYEYEYEEYEEDEEEEVSLITSPLSSPVYSEIVVVTTPVASPLSSPVYSEKEMAVTLVASPPCNSEESAKEKKEESEVNILNESHFVSHN